MKIARRRRTPDASEPTDHQPRAAAHTLPPPEPHAPQPDTSPYTRARANGTSQPGTTRPAQGPNRTGRLPQERSPPRDQRSYPQDIIMGQFGKCGDVETLVSKFFSTPRRGVKSPSSNRQASAPRPGHRGSPGGTGRGAGPSYDRQREPRSKLECTIRPTTCCMPSCNT